MAKKVASEQLRTEVYPMCLRLMKKGLEMEAYIIILSTWNFASFRYVMRTFDLAGFKKTLQEIEPLYRKLNKLDFRTADLDKYKKKIKEIYSKLYKYKGIKITGTPKLMHLKNPKLFVMWDDRIKKHYGFYKGDAEDYFNFLKLMQRKFKSCKPRKGMTLVRTIDLLNMERITHPKTAGRSARRTTIE